MIILLDQNVWQKLAEFYEKGEKKNGILIVEKHLIDDGVEHWVKDLAGKRLLGMVNLICVSLTKIDEISLRYIEASGFPSKEILKRTFLTFSKDVSAITVAGMRITETEKYWCPKCSGVNLNYLTKDIHANQLPFYCFNCKEEFYTPDKNDGSPRIKNAKLVARYCEERIKRIPLDQQAVVAVAGENWLF